ncbi:unnamed protein product [Brassicogethes aeneus]|uniref:Tudor domain-containing protein n=1 Tax=Brassicogethes aeneus TaxID=1431903 RepID=A0A9P0FNU0_BRAAE|nr:unnamed protein product [Brassicogethes aeneus]
MNLKAKQRRIIEMFNVQKWVIGKTYEIRVVHMYNPSTIWIVSKHRSLEYFRTKMNKFFRENFISLRMPYREIVEGLYCAVCREGQFYRGLIIKVFGPCSNKMKIVISFIDFGSLAVVDPNLIFILPDNMFAVPAFAIRARIWNIRPFDANAWSDEEIHKVSLIIQSGATCCVIDYVDKQFNMLNIRLGIMDKTGNHDIAHQLVKENAVLPYNGIYIRDKFDDFTKNDLIDLYKAFVKSCSMLVSSDDSSSDESSEDEDEEDKTPTDEGASTKKGSDEYGGASTNKVPEEDKGATALCDKYLTSSKTNHPIHTDLSNFDKIAKPLGQDKDEEIEINIITSSAAKYLKFLQPMHFRVENGLVPKSIHECDLKTCMSIDRRISRAKPRK